MPCDFRLGLSTIEELQKAREDDIKKAESQKDAVVRLRNPHVANMKSDILYHLALGSGSHDLEAMFGDVKYVCMGGTPRRMEQFARFLMDEIGYELPTGAQLSDISQLSYRYSMYKVGPVLSVSHGMGIPSVGILLHEMIKLMYHAKVKDPTFFRLGTCGGIGIPGGNLVISESAVDGMMNPYLELPVLGKLLRRPAVLDRQLAEDLKALHMPDDKWDTYIGRTMCTTDFYEGQGRLDGAFCDYTEQDKLNFLKKIHAEGIINMEMESLMFAALCHHAGIRGAVVCVTLLDRLKGDQVDTDQRTMHEWQEYPQRLVSRYIRRQLEQHQEPGTPGFQAAHNTLSPCEPGVIRSLSQLNLTRQTSEQVNSSE
ncbi:Uridine phosphorylase 1 [Amphibalanus amphitrite]|uniref:Uridine phosphorylase 1 n=1 Tax=Amphibalanus amphitrite TaxID=1232801 RepID=A0A6A4VMY9_AMPAM|nr:uridine phosphorylase 1-like isoform X1 [Amphibalanus amphitrite]XP_043236514.1 uridine phosphorylase 1-like isoform X1 [Amphibalanus amphitrite]XP_043236515.1 uridine phosphorylase 1-like isoform X1 [Amphibalanus amphitrite]XP_043236516.1 uridine phosphorylase 1-like isoform X1 [Amphibalanus amphitrite]XP_043236518.1 uridine phosphorylase 1-like isoform X1 [Amphibalanus amphitrite]KAF0294309.1 Uridine phosphorylase 1 [Amphibalanus amphitrite]